MTMSVWLHILNVRRSEWKLVKTLYLFEFFQGAGLAFFFTASFALFLSKFSIAELPKIFIYSAFLLWIAGFIYTKLEASCDIIKLSKYITLFTAACFLTFRLTLASMPPGFLFLMLSWFNVLYLLNSLQFWGIASQLFDVRQSKRLFGLISAGDIPAKFIGYSLALLLVSYIGTENLLWIGFFCILGSLPFLSIIDEFGILKEKHNHHPKAPRKKITFNAAAVIRNFSSNLLIRRIAILTIITSSAFIIVNFSFYAKVKEALHSDVSLAQFIAFFLASVRILALFVKMVFTGRLINKLGITRSLVITPALMILLIVAVLVSDNLNTSQSFSLYMFGAMAIVVDILRTSINAPVFLTLMQPLNTHERLRAHNITKGIMDPFASLLTGVLLLVLLNFRYSVDLVELNYILLILGVCWIIGIYRIHQQYLKTLIKAIGNRFFNNPEFTVSDSSTLNWMKEKLMLGSESEVLNILKMITSQPDLFKNDIVLSALDHPSHIIKMEAIKLADKTNLHHLKDRLRELLNESSEPALTAEIIKVLCANDLREEEIMPFVYHQDNIIQKAAVVGILKNGNPEKLKQVRAYLSGMVYSEDVQARTKAVLILQELGEKHYREEVLQLIDDPEKDIRKEAFIAAGRMRDPILLKLVLDQINDYELSVTEALYVAKETSLPLLQSFILNHQGKPLQIERLIRLIGRIGGSKSNELLFHLMGKLPEYLQVLIKTFYYANYSAPVQYRGFFESQVRNCLKRSVMILYMQQLLTPQKDKYGLLYNSLQIELVNLRDNLLYFFALLYDRNKIKDVRAAFESKKKEAIANAMEIVEMTVKKDFANNFNLIFEPIDIDYKIYSIKKMYPSNFFVDVERILSSILDTEDFNYNFWTKACSIYTSKDHHHTINKNLINKYVQAEHPLLSETAKYAL